jgi:glycosidase
MTFRPLSLALLALVVLAACDTPENEAPSGLATGTVPEWAVDAVWYQIFPERFRNGDPSNDPTRLSLETPVVPGEDWAVTPWTSDWYERAAWEEEVSENFYEPAVFHRRYGGDLQGVIDKLDYLQDLGVTALYFNPVFYGRSLHKYDGNTFHHVDPYFGPDPEGDLLLMSQETSDPSTWHMTAADSLFFVMLGEAHERGMRVVIDGVWNHTGRDFFAFDDLRRNGAASPYADWYVVNTFEDPDTDEVEFDYEGWWGHDTLPVFSDTDDGTDLHPAPKQYVFDATARWMDPNGDGDPSDGIDGWRLDVAEEVPIRFWQDWNRHVRELNPNAYTVTEVWQDAQHFISEGGFSATMNYHAFAFPVKGFLVDGETSAQAFADSLDARRVGYDPATAMAMQNLVDSHDTDRIASMIVNAKRRPYHPDALDRFDYDWNDRVAPRNDPGYLVRAPNARERDIQRLVTLFQTTYVGAPMFYYGTEAGMWGADDPDVRKPMVWDDLTYAVEASDPLGRPRDPDPVAFDRDLYGFFQDAIALRTMEPAFSRGTYRQVYAQGQVFAFERELDGNRYLVVLNRSEQPAAFVASVESDDPRVRFNTGDYAPTRRASQASVTQGGVQLSVPALTGAVVQL